ncbi:MAG: YCF48-related protein [Candidatus Acidiferrum sp.]
MLLTLVVMFAGVTVYAPRWRAPSGEPHTNAREFGAAGTVSWSVQTSGIDTNLRGVSATESVDANGTEHIAVWACGSNGVILLSNDLGKTWKRLHVAGGDGLDFRSIVALDARNAFVMSSGNGDKSRIYKTADSGENWKLEYSDSRKAFFLDALACDGECFALSDPIDGKFVILATHHYEDWKELPGDGMPAALPGEGAFAASGTSLAVSNDTGLYFGTGGGKAARVFHSADLGKTWSAVETPIASGNASSGIFSISSTTYAVNVVGGDYKDQNRPYHVAAYSQDQGKTWRLAAQQPGGFRSAVASIDGATLAAVGPGGEDFSDDFGVHWKHADSLDLNAVFVLDIDNGWAVGAKGTVARLVNRKQYSIRNDSNKDDSALAFTSSIK